MNLVTMRANVRRDLKDEDSGAYRWTDDEIDRAIQRAVTAYSLYSPREMKSTLATVNGSAQLDISSLTSRVSVDKVEYPISHEPRQFARFSVYQDILYFEETEGDGANCYVYWTTVHSLITASSSILTIHDDLIALGASAYAALAIAQYHTNRANYGGQDVDMDYKSWGDIRLADFITQCKKLNSKLRSNTLLAKLGGQNNGL
jgi:hypothetical protein